MRISIVIPSFNQATFLDETLRSLINQQYHDLEIVVIDGGSTDHSPEVIKQFEKDIAYSITEPDNGQTDAINKGLKHISGDVWSYLNSDDILLPGSLQYIEKMFADDGVLWGGAVSTKFDDTGDIGEVRPKAVHQKLDYLLPWIRKHPYVFPCSNVTFYRRSLLSEIGNFDESYDYCMDTEYNIRIVFRTGIGPTLSDEIIGKWRWHADSKTMKTGLWFGFLEETIRIAENYLAELPEEDKRTVIDMLKVQKKNLVVRRASYFRQRGELLKAAKELTQPLPYQPRLLISPAWLGMALRIAALRRGTMAQ